MSNSTPQRIVIVGGAIIGSSIAWFLRERGFTGAIVVVETDATYRFSSTALSAASIRTQFATPVNVRMSLFGIAFLRDLKQRFGPDADIGYVEHGYLILGGAGSTQARRAGVEMQCREGADVVALTPDELAKRFPYMDFTDVEIGTFGRRGEGWFDAWSLLSLIRGAARRRGVDYVANRVTGFDVSGASVRRVRLADGDGIDCDCCIIAAGALSGALVASLSIDLPVSPRKRTVFHFRAPLKVAGFPMLFDTSGVWVRPEGDGFIGGIQPPDDQDPDATDDFEPQHHLLEETVWPVLATRIPAMEQLRLERAWAGHYEVNALDHNGIIGPHDQIPNLIFATGFSGHGVMHAPAVGRGVAELIVDGRYTSIDLAPLGWDRIRDRRPLSESVVY